MLDVIDIASHQWKMDLNNTFQKNPTLDAVIVKTTGGSSYENPYAKGWIEWLKANNKCWGFYHYVTEGSIRRTAQQEADWCLLKCEKYFGEGTAWLDYEDPVAKALGPNFLHDVAQKIYERTGVKPGVYFSGGLLQWQDFSALANEGYPFWCARYANQKYTSWQTNPWQGFSIAPFTKMTLLQYTSKGRIPGWGENLDLELFFGGEADWKALAKGEPMPPPLKQADPVIVAEVLANRYGVNPGRAEKLKQAGYDAYSVQKKINELNTLALKIKPIVSTNQDYMDSIVKLIQQ